MKTHFNLYAPSLILCMSVLAGCSSAPIDEVPIDVADTAVQDAEAKVVGAELGTADTDEVELTTDASTVFYFDFDKALLNDESRKALLEHALVLKSNSRSIRLKGHADERGTREYNMALGERRALAVKEFLVFQGVTANRIEVISYGEERAAAYGSNEKAWSMNRRVELK